MMITGRQPNPALAAAITKAASKQTYFTIRFLVDRERVADAYRAYAYFRWVDDCLDADSISSPERNAFIQRQKSLLADCLAGSFPAEPCPQERMLVELVRRDGEKTGGLRAYLVNMMAVMEFDAARRGRVISQAELDQYTRWLAIAVTEAMHHFVGHDCFSPRGEGRHLAVSAAHITHMLRDAAEDLHAGYFNIPREVLEVNQISPQDFTSPGYRLWVRRRVKLARLFFSAGRKYLQQCECLRCRLAGFAYMARFEWLLDTFERENYLLRPAYPERNSPGAVARIFVSLFSQRVSKPGEIAPRTIPAGLRSASPGFRHNFPGSLGESNHR